MERNLSENDRQSINSNCKDWDDVERRKGHSMVSEEIERRKKKEK